MIGALILAAFIRSNGLDRVASGPFAICAFLLQPAQVNIASVTNFTPGILNDAIHTVSGPTALRPTT